MSTWIKVLIVVAVVIFVLGLLGFGITAVLGFAMFSSAYNSSTFQNSTKLY